MKCRCLILVLFLLPALRLNLIAAGIVLFEEERRWIPPRPPIIVPSPHPIPRPRPVPRPLPARAVEVQQHKVRVSIDDQIARTHIEQVFYNPNARRMQGTFFFPVPKGAQLDGFTLEIDGKKTEAELLAADQARKIYEDIVRSMRDPALLEYAGQDVFKIRIFPFEPHGRRTITLAYTEVLKMDSGLVQYVCPLAPAKYSATNLKNVSLSVELKTPSSLKSIWSPSHEVDIRRREKSATVAFEATDIRPDADFQLYFSSDSSDLGANLLAHHPDGEDGYFLLLVTPAIKAANEESIPKDVVFVLDTSGSMAGPKLEQAKKALLFCVENLNEGDRFEVLKFATEVDPLFDKLSAASGVNRKRARSFIQSLKPIGSTAIDDALERALEMAPEDSERPYVVIFLTDGKPTIGVTRESDIVRNVEKRNSTLTRIFCFGIGTDVNTHLLDKITEQTKAFSQYVLPEEDLEIKVSNFFSKIKEPALADVKLKFSDGIRVSKLYPSSLPDLFKGDQLMVAGRYSGNGKAKVQLSGLINGAQHQFSFDARLPRKSGKHSFIPRLWATRRVGYLLDQIRLHGENSEVKGEVTQLARQYGIVTPYTAFLIVEDERRRGITMRNRLLPQMETDSGAAKQAQVFYDQFRREKSGDFGLASAQFTADLKSARTAAPASESANRRVDRALSVTSPRPSTTSSASSLAQTPGNAAAGPLTRPDAGQRVMQYAQQNRFVAGKTFFQNGTQWVDSAAQSLANGQPVRVGFGTDAYFALLKQFPEANEWLALGTQMQIVLRGILYEIH